jgi:hypothetical protein
VTKVTINSGGHYVEVDHDSTDLSYVVEKAQKLWDETKPSERSAGFGLNAGNGHHPAGIAAGGSR